MSSFLRPFRSEATIVNVDEEKGETFKLKPNLSYQQQQQGQNSPKKRNVLFPANLLIRGGGGGKKKGSALDLSKTNTPPLRNNDPVAHDNGKTSPGPATAVSATPSPLKSLSKIGLSIHKKEKVELEAPKGGFLTQRITEVHVQMNESANGPTLNLRGFHSTNSFSKETRDTNGKSKKLSFPKLNFLDRDKTRKLEQEDALNRPLKSDRLPIVSRGTSGLIHPDSDLLPRQHRSTPFSLSTAKDALFSHNPKKSSADDSMAQLRSVPMSNTANSPLPPPSSNPVFSSQVPPQCLPKYSVPSKQMLLDRKKETSHHSSFMEDEGSLKRKAPSKFRVSSFDVSSLRSDEREKLAAHFESTKAKLETLPKKSGKESESSLSSSSRTNLSARKGRSMLSYEKNVAEGGDQSTENTQSLSQHAGGFALTTKMELWDELEVAMFLKEIHMEAYQERFLSQCVNGEILVDLDDIDLSLIPVNNPSHRTHILKMISRYRARLRTRRNVTSDDLAQIRVAEWLKENSEFLPTPSVSPFP